ncbi:unnamed protein product [Symbiodinium microadriaticum]|nr:unnamed protein product [Symbiodinium microadriaticum]
MAEAVKFEKFGASVNEHGVCRAVSLSFVAHVLGCEEEEGEVCVPMPSSGYLPDEVEALQKWRADELYDESDFVKDLTELRAPAPILMSSFGDKLALHEMISEKVDGWDAAMAKVGPQLELGDQKYAFVFSFYYLKLDGRREGRHAIAVDTSGREGHYHVMDPNQGVWQFDSIGALVRWLRHGAELVAGKRVHATSTNSAAALNSPATMAKKTHPLDLPWTCGRSWERFKISWLWPLLHTGVRHALQEQDVWPVPEKLRAERVGNRAAELWREECDSASSRRPPRLARPLLRLAVRPTAQRLDAIRV